MMGLIPLFVISICTASEVGAACFSESPCTTTFNTQTLTMSSMRVVLAAALVAAASAKTLYKE